MEGAAGLTTHAVAPFLCFFLVFTPIFLHQFVSVALYYSFHIPCATVAHFQAVFVEYFLERVVFFKMLVDQIAEFSADRRFDG